MPRLKVSYRLRSYCCLVPRRPTEAEQEALLDRLCARVAGKAGAEVEAAILATMREEQARLSAEEALCVP